MAKKLANGVWLADKFYPAGSTPPKDVAEQITNPRAWSGEDGDPQVDTVVGAPSQEDLERLEAEAKGDGTTSADADAVQDDSSSDTVSDDEGDEPAKAPAKKAPAKKATAKRAASSS